MNRPTVLTSLLSLILATPLLAATNVASNLSADNHWVQGGSPYLIQGKVTVPAGSHLTIDPAVQVIFQGAAVLEVNGTIDVNGSAAGPAVFNLQEGGLQSEIFINGGEAHFTNVKILGGVFLAKDAKLAMDGAEVTKGSGLYLQGSTVAHLKNNKLYGNSTGVVLDGQVMADLKFNTLVQNTYGLYLKSYSSLTCQYNSIHDNQMEVISQVPSAKLGGNYWGANNSKDLMPKIQGKVALSPMKTLKDVLRVYVRTQLPVITKQMAVALAARERKEEKQAAAALKKYRAQLNSSTKAPAPPVPSAPAAASAPPVPSAAAPATTPEAAAVPPVPAVPEAAGVAPPPPAPSGTEASSSPAAPAPPAPATGSSDTIPAPPDLAEQVPPSPSSAAPATTAAVSNVPPAPPVPSGDIPAPPSTSTSSTSSTASAPAPAAPPAAPSVPEAPAVAAAPSGPAVSDSSMPVPTPIPPAQATASQMKTMGELKGVSGDIDGMQAPPLETNSEVTTGTGSKSKKKTSNVSNLDLPPLKDSEILPPNDLDLPPIEGQPIPSK